MRKAGIILILFILGCGALRAQHYLGIRGGWGVGSARFTPDRETGFQSGLYNAGVSYRFYTSQKYVGGIQADLQYSGRGFMYKTRNNGDTTYHRLINSFELPIMWQPHFYIAQRYVRVFLNLGVYLSYMINSRYYYQDKAGIFERGTYKMLLTRDPRWGYGLCGGGGITGIAGRFEISVEARYYFGYSDVLRTGSKYKGNPTHSPLDNLNFSFALYYRLGKEGIRSAPSAGVARRMQEAEKRRTQKLLDKARKQGLPIDSLPDDNLSRTMPDTLKGKIPSGITPTEGKKSTGSSLKQSKELPSYLGVPGDSTNKSTSFPANPSSASPNKNPGKDPGTPPKEQDPAVRAEKPKT